MNETKLVKVSISTNKLIDEISSKRKKAGEFNRTKQDVIAEAILALHKKECR